MGWHGILVLIVVLFLNLGGCKLDDSGASVSPGVSIMDRRLDPVPWHEGWSGIEDLRRTPVRSRPARGIWRLILG